jgi:hypothetical protein
MTKSAGVEHHRLLAEYARLYRRGSSKLESSVILEREVTLMRAIMIDNAGVVGPGGTDPSRVDVGGLGVYIIFINAIIISIALPRRAQPY